MKINVGNLNLYVKISGKGIPFIWAHGLMGSTQFDDIANWFNWDALSDVVKLIRYDARGHGLSDASYTPEDYRWSNLAKDMIAIADSLDIDTFIAGGQSMGCATAIYTSLAVPERVLGLVLATPPTAWEVRTTQSAIWEQLAKLIETRGVKALVGLLKQRPLLPEWLLKSQPEILENLLKFFQTLNEKVLPIILRGAALSNLPPRNKLKSLKIPTLILAWADDATHPLTVAEELNELLPNSQLIIANNFNDLKTWPQIIRNFVTKLAHEKPKSS
ncbi:MAG: alpha/beta fold hydrolase [Candidatus Baldrarchaeia archaeon]